MNPDRYPVSGTALQAVSRERAPGNTLQTADPPTNNPTAASQAQTHVPTRRRVVRIAARFAPRPPQTKRKATAASHSTHKSLVVSAKIKAHSAKSLRP